MRWAHSSPFPVGSNPNRHQVLPLVSFEAVFRHPRVWAVAEATRVIPVHVDLPDRIRGRNMRCYVVAADRRFVVDSLRSTVSGILPFLRSSRFSWYVFMHTIHNRTAATLDDYGKHQLDTRTLRSDRPDYVELHMYPEIVAKVAFGPD
jgi:hypothetical protein